MSSIQLDRRSPIPLYHQLKQIIKTMIEKGELIHGGAFWTEQELAQMSGASRTTIREALRGLEEEGYLVIQQGKRSSVSKPKVTRNFLGFSSFSEDMKGQGLIPGSRLLAFEIVVPTPEMARKLELDEGEKVVELKRQMLANGEPIGYHIVYLPLCVWEKLQVKPAFLNNRSLYQSLEEKGGIILEEAYETIEVDAADQETAKILNIRRGKPVLMMNRITFASKGIPVEYAIVTYRADRYRYEIYHQRQRPNRRS